jgi:hypothetical protein
MSNLTPYEAFLLNEPLPELIKEVVAPAADTDEDKPNNKAKPQPPTK